MEKKDFLKAHKHYEKIEDMPMRELKKVIEQAMDVKLSPIVPIPYKGGIPQTIVYKCSELIARCPMTLIPDFYTITITFIPNKHIPELKSLRDYFRDYFDIPISHEHLQAKIFSDFKKAIKPKRLRIELDAAIRGGIKTDIVYENNSK
jgi:7-cyano-7-deazaguanine reductase